MGFARGPNLVTREILTVFDAASPRSYPGSGTELFDLVSDNNFTLVNSPTYGSGNFGEITFDGSNDYMSNDGSDWMERNFENNQAFTVGSFFKPTSAVNGNTRSALYANQKYKTQGSPGGFGINLINGQYYMNFTAENAGGDGSNGAESYQTMCTIDFITGSDTFIVYTWDGIDTLKAYRDGVLENSLTNSSRSWTTASNSIHQNQRIGTSTQGGWANYFEMDWYNFHLYGTNLTDAEILQNYNALKGRFGL